MVSDSIARNTVKLVEQALCIARTTKADRRQKQLRPNLELTRIRRTNTKSYHYCTVSLSTTTHILILSSTVRIDHLCSFTQLTMVQSNRFFYSADTTLENTKRMDPNGTQDIDGGLAS